MTAITPMLPLFSDPYEENACHCPDAPGSGSTRRNREATGERSVYMSGRYRKVPGAGTQDFDMSFYCQNTWCQEPYISWHENARVGLDKHWSRTQDVAFRLGAVAVLERYNQTQHLIKVTYRTSRSVLATELGWLTECEHHQWLAGLVTAHRCVAA